MTENDELEIADNVDTEGEAEVLFAQIVTCINSLSVAVQDSKLTPPPFSKVLEAVELILNKKTKKFDAHALEAELDVQVDIKDVCEANYDKKLKEVAAHRDFLIEQEGRVKSYVSWYSKCIELMTAYILLTSKQKSIELKRQEAFVQLQNYHLRKEIQTDLLTRLESKRISFSLKYEAVSRLLAYWDTMTKVNFSRNSPK